MKHARAIHREYKPTITVYRGSKCPRCGSIFANRKRYKQHRREHPKK